MRKGSLKTAAVFALLAAAGVRSVEVELKEAVGYYEFIWTVD